MRIPLPPPALETSCDTKTRVISATIGLYDRISAMYAEHGILLPLDRSCLHWANATLAACEHFGLVACIQGGSFSAKANDDGNYIAFEWQDIQLDELPALAKLLTTTSTPLPEMHAWVGIVDTQELIDLSTIHLRRSAKRNGLEWTEAEYPNGLWVKCDAIPDTLAYAPYKTASLLAGYISYSITQEIRRMRIGLHPTK